VDQQVQMSNAMEDPKGFPESSQNPDYGSPSSLPESNDSVQNINSNQKQNNNNNHNQNLSFAMETSSMENQIRNNYKKTPKPPRQKSKDLETKKYNSILLTSMIWLLGGLFLGGVVLISSLFFFQYFFKKRYLDAINENFKKAAKKIRLSDNSIKELKPNDSNHTLAEHTLLNLNLLIKQLENKKTKRN
jgi:hypothetical protein